MNPNKQVFISRNLSPNSTFAALVQSQGWQVQGQSLLDINYLPIKQPLIQSDWYFFYSGLALMWFWTQCQGQKLPKIALLGPSKAQWWTEHYGQKPDFVGNGQPEQTAKNFDQLSANQSITFFRAKNSRQSLEHQLQSGQRIFSEIIYDNQIIKSFNCPQAQVLVFTSPLNVQAYFQHCQAQAHQRFLAIGQTTAQALNNLGLKAEIAQEANEEQLARLVLSPI